MWRKISCAVSVPPGLYGSSEATGSFWACVKIPPGTTDFGAAAAAVPTAGAALVAPAALGWGVFVGAAFPPPHAARIAVPAPTAAAPIN